MTKAGKFILWLLSQDGKPYIYGAEVDPGDPDPQAFDCSELTQIGINRQGIPFPDGAAQQYKACKPIPVETAKKTPGALLFIRDAHAYPNKIMNIGHVAVVISKFHCIEAKGKAYGVTISPITNRFSLAGKVADLYVEV